MASEKCVAPKNVEPFSDPKGVPNASTATANREKSIYVYSGGECIRNFIGTIEIVAPNHFRIHEAGVAFDVYNATIIASDHDSPLRRF